MKLRYIIYGLLCLSFASSCTKYDDPAPLIDELDVNTTKQRKILIVSIDGLTGAELNTVAPKNMVQLQSAGKYSFDVASGAVATDASGWASLLTGVSYTDHQISQNNFERDQDSNDEHGDITLYRNVFDYIAQYKAVKTALVTPWDNLRNYVKNVDFSPIVNSDALVKDSTVNLLSNVTDLGAIMVNFRDVEVAGDNGGFLATNPIYKDAINRIDGYVGDLMNAVTARKNYSNEDWLIVITTNHGGSSADPQPGFVIYYSSNFKKYELRKRGFNTVRFTGTPVYAEVPNDGGLYDGGSNKEFTIQGQVKFNGQTSYPCMLSKGTGIAGGKQTGWLFFEEGASIGTSWGGTLTNTGNRTQVGLGGQIADKQWHTFTATVKIKSGTTRTVTTYQDGVQQGTLDINYNLTALNEPLRIGFKAVDDSGSGDFQMANLMYFNTALSATTIQNNLDRKEKDMPNHPNYANLVGYWPIDDGVEGKIKNKAPVGFDMVLRGPYTWVPMGTDVPPGTVLDPEAANGLSVSVVTPDVMANAMYWMKISILPDFGITGIPYLNKFEIEFLK